MKWHQNYLPMDITEQNKILTDKHKSGFVNIIGEPNVGKSTLMNALVGEKMSIITRKPQTTRHRIIGLLNSDEFQIVFSDTPGYVKDPSYKMHEAMNQFVRVSYEDADVILYVIDAKRNIDDTHPILTFLQKTDIPIFVLLNKMDLVQKEKIKELTNLYQELLPKANVYSISALQKLGTDRLLKKILKKLPLGPAYYSKDQLTDKPERFFVSEIIREKILEQFHDEIPYSCEVIVESFKHDEGRNGPLIRIRAVIFVMRKSQKAILIGKAGSAIKSLGTAARKEIESFLDKHVFLELHIKVRDNWRDNDQALKNFGYKS